MGVGRLTSFFLDLALPLRFFLLTPLPAALPLLPAEEDVLLPLRLPVKPESDDHHGGGGLG